MVAQVTIIGAGIFGLATALACAEAGARVRVIERSAIAAGASGGQVGALAPHVPERWNDKKQVQFESLIAATAYWRRIEIISEMRSGYGRIGRLQPLADARAVALARRRGESAARLWRGRARWQVIPAATSPDWAPASPTDELIWDDLSARIDPRAATHALAEAFRRHGGEIVVGEAPTGPADLTPTPVGAVIWATGHDGLAQLGADLGRLMGGGVKGQSALLGLDARGRPQIFAEGIHIVPHDDGTVAIGSTSERHFDASDTTDTQLDALIERARVACPALAGAPVLARWAGVRPRAISRAPLVGAWPGRPGHFIANGGFKIGFALAPRIGAMLAELVVLGRDRIPREFRPETLITDET